MCLTAFFRQLSTSALQIGFYLSLGITHYRFHCVIYELLINNFINFYDFLTYNQKSFHCCSWHFITISHLYLLEEAEKCYFIVIKSTKQIPFSNTYCYDIHRLFFHLECSKKKTNILNSIDICKDFFNLLLQILL